MYTLLKLLLYASRCATLTEEAGVQQKTLWKQSVLLAAISKCISQIAIKTTQKTCSQLALAFRNLVWQILLFILHAVPTLVICFQ